MGLALTAVILVATAWAPRSCSSKRAVALAAATEGTHRVLGEAEQLRGRACPTRIAAPRGPAAM